MFPHIDNQPGQKGLKKYLSFIYLQSKKKKKNSAKKLVIVRVLYLFD